MLDTYFQHGQKFAYDVGNTIGRAANMLLMRGIRVTQGEHPHTDGEELIVLPQAMKRWLTWDEIDFVRYLLHHEAAHIKFSDPPRTQYSRLMHTIFNALEDIRIEAKDRKSMAGSGFIYDTGHRISLEIWDKACEGWASGSEQSIEHALVHAIYACSIDKDLRGVSVTPLTDYLHKVFVDNGVYDKIDLIDDRTPSVDALAHEIFDLLRIEFEGTDVENCGMPQGLPHELRESSQVPPLAPDSTFSGGMAELCAKTLDAGKDEEKVDISQASKHSNGLSLGYNYANSQDRLNEEQAKENYEWGKAAAGAAGHVINLLRGQTRAAWSNPKESGLRIAQRSVPEFMSGLTNNILRRRKCSPRVGTSVFLMVDDSSSMCGDFDTPAWRAAAMLGHACERAQLRLMIARFSDSVGIEKYWHTPMAKIRNRFALAMGGCTNAADALDVSRNYLEMERSHRRVLFFLTDGCTGHHATKVAREIMQSGVELYPILLGEGAVRAALRGGRWDFPQTSKILKPDQSLASTILSRLACVIR